MVFLGQHHSLAIDKTGTVWTWGTNFWGILGNGRMLKSGPDINVPVKVNSSGYSGEKLFIYRLTIAEFML